MKVMRRAVIEYRDTQPLPGEMTNERVNNATLPVKIEAARRAIAECVDLPELLKYRDQAEGLAAAVRTMKTVGPDMIRAANEMMADAWRKGGELLSQYSSVAVTRGGFKNVLNTSSPRAQIAERIGLKKPEAAAMVRTAASSPSKVYEAVQKSKSLYEVARSLPAVSQSMVDKRARGKSYSENLLPITKELADVKYRISRIPLGNFKHLAPDERKVVKAKITEIMEVLDEMDRLCK